VDQTNTTSNALMTGMGARCSGGNVDLIRCGTAAWGVLTRSAPFTGTGTVEVPGYGTLTPRRVDGR
jgi:hypothetical protein